MRLVPFQCPTHGWVMDTFPRASVWCKCGKKCAPDEGALALANPELARAAAKRRAARERRARTRANVPMTEAV